MLAKATAHAQMDSRVVRSADTLLWLQVYHIQVYHVVCCEAMAVHLLKVSVWRRHLQVLSTCQAPSTPHAWQQACLCVGPRAGYQEVGHAKSMHSMAAEPGLSSATHLAKAVLAH